MLFNYFLFKNSSENTINFSCELSSKENIMQPYEVSFVSVKSFGLAEVAY